MRKIKLETHKYYHVYNRGANKQIIFVDNQDRYRFLRKIWELNNTTKSEYRDYLLRQFNIQDENLKEEPGSRYLEPGSSLRFSFHEYYKKLSEYPKLVDVVCYNLLDNHYHFILRQLINKGIEIFLHKIGTSYSNSFNNYHGHSGTLFQGPFKAYPILNDNKLCWLSAYVNCNYEIHKLGRAQDWQFSSYPDYLNQRHGKLVNKKVVMGLFGDNIKIYQKYCQNIIRQAQDDKKAKQYLLNLNV